MLTHYYSYFLKMKEKGTDANINAVPAYSLRLYSNVVTPTVDSVVADFTEVSGTNTNYAAKPITMSSLTVTLGSGGNQTTSSYTEQIFEFLGSASAGVVVNGYYLTATVNSVPMLLAAYADTTFTTTASGDKYKVTLHLDTLIGSS